jgi:cell wall-associated NlpC family hydrolase
VARGRCLAAALVVGAVRSGPHVSRSNLQPGDLVFFYSPISHVGIYIGGGKMIDAPHPGLSVRITSISHAPVLRRRPP